MPELRAVVVDDDKLSHLVYSRIFKAHNINVRFCSQHSQCPCKQPGVQTCPVAEPCVDFLLTEFWTPGMTGVEFLNWLKQMNCKIPDSCKALISTSWSDKDLAEARKVTHNVFHKAESKEKISLWIEEGKRLSGFG